MLFALKLIWFVLAILGTIGSCFTLLALGALVGSQWIPISFCVALTILEFTFCIGMIWRLDPFAMPRSFCIAQAIIMNTAIYETGGVCMAWCIQTSLHILRPKLWPNIEESFRWRPIYLVPCVLYPVVLIIKYDAVQPADGMYCDAMDPLWIRTIAHSGPALTFPVTCIRRVMTTLQHVERARSDQTDIPRQMRRAADGSRAPVQESFPMQSKTSRGVFQKLQSISHGFTPAPPPSDPNPNSGWDDDDAVSIASSNLPTFAPVPDKRRKPSQSTSVDITPGSIPWLDDSEPSLPDTSEGHGTAGLEVKNPEEEDDQTYRLSYTERAPSRVSHVAHVTKFTPHIFRLLVFQLLFSLSLPVDMLSSVVDAALHRETKFATHYVSLLLVAWGPVVIFGSSSDVRGRIARWFIFWSK
ncbi:hypothetical protein FB45DRAFT_908254 [Roridomyces roridus]|uniref:Uncharacterized protein n=1 Tax=Roridomyces roridus TaxID=1738132 RepID=A0AAD7C2G9_9AGAR|nr:hypothetical protein FB45DRAFT_908254 [Roridomyces roridus]